MQAIAESLISSLFLSFLSSGYHLLGGQTNEKLDSYADSLKYSNHPQDQEYRDNFQIWGHPADTFAIQYARTQPILALFLQSAIFCIMMLFAALFGVLVYLVIKGRVAP